MRIPRTRVETFLRGDCQSQRWEWFFQQKDKVFVSDVNDAPVITSFDGIGLRLLIIMSQIRVSIYSRLLRKIMKPFMAMRS